MSIRLTEQLKGWLVDNADVQKDASDDEFRATAGEQIANGGLALDELLDLTKDPDEVNASALEDRIVGRLEKLMERRGDADDNEKSAKFKGFGNADTDVKASHLVAGGGGTPEDIDIVSKGVRLKGAHEAYDDTKTALRYPELTAKEKPHALAGKQVTDFGRSLDKATDRDHALCGAWWKFLMAAKVHGGAYFGYQHLPEHDKGLLHYLADETQWDNTQKDGRRAEMKGYPGGVKALIDDSVSGGLEAAPIVFDDRVIETPLLFGELFPMVNTIVLDRGRRIEGVEVGTVTGTWGGADNSTIALFNTNSYVSAFDTTIFRWEGAIEIGLDFISDTPINFGQLVTRQYGERLLQDLDDVIAAGDGTTQPEGLSNKSGFTSVAFGGSTTLGGYESLRFGILKNEHRADVRNTAVFVGTETSYIRAHAIPVGASDARRLGGMDYDSYMWMNRPYKINESLANTVIIYTLLARYRMYRRRGFSVRTSTEGKTLMLNNNMLVVAMARYGGQAERGAIVAKTTTAPA